MPRLTQSCVQSCGLWTGWQRSCGEGTGGRAGGAPRPPWLLVLLLGLGLLARWFLMFVLACFVLVKGSLLTTAFVNISCSTKGRKICTQTTGGEGSKSGGEGIQTRLMRAFTAWWHRCWFYASYSYGLQSCFKCKLELKLDLFAGYWG